MKKKFIKTVQNYLKCKRKIPKNFISVSGNGVASRVINACDCSPYCSHSSLCSNV